MKNKEVEMSNWEQLVARIQLEPQYLNNVQWGEPRDGHPEGSIHAHIMELERNLSQLDHLLTSEEVLKLRLMIHTHDTFKPDAKRGVPIADPRSHASIAREFVSRFTENQDLLNMIQLHDEPYAIWLKYRSGKSVDDRLETLLKTIRNWDLFLAFLLVDNCTLGKSTVSLEWFFNEIEGKVETRVDSNWMNLLPNHSG